MLLLSSGVQGASPEDPECSGSGCLWSCRACRCTKSRARVLVALLHFMWHGGAHVIMHLAWVQREPRLGDGQRPQHMQLTLPKMCWALEPC